MHALVHRDGTNTEKRVSAGSWLWRKKSLLHQEVELHQQRTGPDAPPPELHPCSGAISGPCNGHKAKRIFRKIFLCKPVMEHGTSAMSISNSPARSRVLFHFFSSVSALTESAFSVKWFQLLAGSCKLISHQLHHTGVHFLFCCCLTDLWPSCHRVPGNK